MNIEQLLKKAKTPAPPAELRQKILEQADFPGNFAPFSIWDRLWINSTLRIGWTVSVVVLTLFLLTWNPPIPGIVEPQRKPPIPMNVILEIGLSHISNKLQESNWIRRNSIQDPELQSIQKGES